MNTEKNKSDEQALISRVKTDPEAFSQLCDIYFPKIFRYISWRTNDRRDTEDLVLEIFSKAFDIIETYKWQKGATFSS